VGRLIGNPKIPPVGLAILFGGAVIIIGQQTNTATVE
jgi:hypothetical protein